ncbi:MAG: ribonuclease H-like YkuK family protein [Candidatus Levybacteria bacterium]|nr:ribonuclease H-like YkuK family protein [Candidatus Levybacteria bacterium]
MNPTLDIFRLKFENITHGVLTSEGVLEIIKNFLEEVPDGKYSLVIGTDSHEKNGSGLSSKNISLVTAIIVHRRGFGGKYFWNKKHVSNIHSLREKIYAETMTSLDFAASFVPLLKKNLNGHSPTYNLEIHIDVGEHGDSRDMIKEVVGLVTGNGFVAKTKPEAYGASYVADKHT